MTERIEQLTEHVETVVYAIVALLLFGIAGVVLVRAALSFGELTEASVIEVSAGILDLLLLVFIVVELLFAVRTTLSRRDSSPSRSCWSASSPRSRRSSCCR